MLLKGILASAPKTPGPPRLVMFQYNPEKLTRNVTAQFGAPGPDGDIRTFKGAPNESISVDVQVESLDSKLAPFGVRPQISALQLMAYPNLVDVGKNELMRKKNKVPIVPLGLPVTVFIMGPTQIVPVNVKSVNIVEEFFDQNLRPVRATISLSMELVPTYNVALMAYQSQLEVYAAANVLAQAASAGAAAGGAAMSAAKKLL